MGKRIVVRRAGRRAYGNEYEAKYFKDGKLVHSEVMFGGDVRSADRAFTKEFQGVSVSRLYGKKARR